MGAGAHRGNSQNGAGMLVAKTENRSASQKTAEFLREVFKGKTIKTARRHKNVGCRARELRGWLRAIEVAAETGFSQDPSSQREFWWLHQQLQAFTRGRSTRTNLLPAR
jgi:hypothetical protein